MSRRSAKKQSYLALLVFFLACLPFASAKKSSLPDWAEDALRDVENAYERFGEKENGVVALSHEQRQYNGKGNVNTYARRVVHLRTKDERAWGQAVIPLRNAGEKLTKFEAWIRYPSGRIENFGKRDLAELAEDMDALYSESKMMILDRVYSMRDDTVFAYEYELSGKSSFGENFWVFQQELPTLESRFEVIVPDHWAVLGHVFNGQGVVADQSGGEYVWVGRNLKPLKAEPNRPALFATATMLGVSIVPDEKARKRYKLEAFESWNDLARYGYAAQREAVRSSEAAARLARQIAAKGGSEIDNIRMICEYVQGVNYVAVNMNLAKGGGYTPREADFVLEKHYGDCKDMTVLARAMLESIGVETYPVIASIGGEEYVHDEWPSPAQFNHCVLAVKVTEAVELPAVALHPTLGKLLIFDPTRKYTPFGRLPDTLQGEKVLVCSERSGTLIELEREASDMNLTRRSVEVKLDEFGTLSGTIIEDSTGLGANYMRRLSRTLADDKFTEMLKAWIAKGTRDARVLSYTVEDNVEANVFRLQVWFEAPLYARRIGEDRLALSPVFLSRREWVPPTEEERTNDYVFQPGVLSETIELSLPDGYSVEAPTELREIAEDFAVYAIQASQSDEKLTVERKLSSLYRRIPKAEYPRVLDFYEGVTRLESAPVVVGRL